MGFEVFDNYKCDGQLELTDCTRNRQLTHLSLFSGIGGLDLAAEWAGFKSVGQCEWADYPTKVLEKHWPNVERWRDIHELHADEFIRRTGIKPGELTVISGGGASHVSRIRLQDCVKRLVTNVIFGRSTGVSLAKLSHDGLWLKMYGDSYQANLDGSFEEYCGILPTWGMMLGGVVIELPISEQFIPENGLGLLPTPQSSDWKSRWGTKNALEKHLKSNHQIRLADTLRSWNLIKGEIIENYEKMMGFGIGWTELKH